ncbi:conserved Plasmodium protein, unknown function [Plasmodium malariae]|uniref:Uncharacterized protein n=1 Tax=Plasmodium malariae TaxID=5858 RepID=A0A1C3KDB7_PLAMA|nr:conserved Plasmodium protein, unknown function [Plasmodium malariae]
MEGVNEKNHIIDKNKVESANKYIYTKFPAFDTHKKIKDYNKKISELVLENGKLKRYMKNIEKRIIEENDNFNTNFSNYEIAICKALRLGYSCIYLCCALSKVINKSKKFVFTELLRRRDKFKNNLIRSYIHKNSFDKLFINSLFIKIDNIYEKNKKFFTSTVVALIKRKMKCIFKMFMNKILELTNQEQIFSNNKLVQYVCHMNSNQSNVSTAEKRDLTLGLVKLMDILRIHAYAILKYSFTKIQKKDANNLFAKGRSSKSFTCTSEQSNNLVILDRDRINEEWRKDRMEKENAVEKFNGGKATYYKENDECGENSKYAEKGVEEKNKVVSHVSSICNRDTRRIFPYDNNLEKKEKVEFAHGKNHLLLDKQNGRYNLHGAYFNFEQDNSSVRSHLPHPKEVYNYLYYKELQKLKKSTSDNFLNNDESTDFEDYLQCVEKNGEVCYLDDSLMKKFFFKRQSTRNTSDEDTLNGNIEDNGIGSYKYKEKNINKNNLIFDYTETKESKKNNTELFLNRLSSFSNSYKLNFIDKKNLHEDNFINPPLLYENKKIAQRENQSNEEKLNEGKKKKKKINFYEQIELKSECSENLINILDNSKKEGYQKDENILNSSFKKKNNMKLSDGLMRDNIHLDNIISCKDNYEKRVEQIYGKENMGDDYNYNCDYEYDVEDYTSDNSIKGKISLHDFEEKFRSMMYQLSTDNEENEDTESKEKENLYIDRIQNMQRGLHKIKEKNFLCLVGEGPPDVLEMNANGKYSFIDADEKEVKGVDSNGKHNRILCAIRKY